MNIGIDYASIDGDAPPDFHRAMLAGVRWVQIRAAFDYGNKELVDTTWRRDYAAAKAAGLKAGPYLFPGWDVGDPSPEEQVKVFASGVGTLEHGVDLVPTLDVEFPRGIAGTHHSRAEIMALLRRFVASMRATFGVWPEIYTSGRVWNTDDADTLGNPAAPDLVDCSPWVARYAYPAGQMPVLNPPRSPAPPSPNTWGFYWKHQYQGDAKGIPGLSSTVDLSYFLNMVPGETSARVPWVRRRLNAWMAQSSTTEPPTLYGPMMVDVVKAFQRVHHLVDDGEIGIGTHTALNWVVL